MAAGGLVATGVTLPGLATRTAGAAETVDLSSLTAVAIASGQRATVSTAGLAAVSDFFDGIGPVTEAKLDGQAGGLSFASLPYPGQTIMQYPAYVALAANGQAVPGYPFYVAANPGEPDQKQGDPTGTYFIEAKAAKDAAGGVARLRGAGGGDAAQAGSMSTTSIGVVDGKVVSTAESVTDGLALGPLKLGSVHSRSVTTYAPGDAEPATTTELRLDGGVVNDQRFSLGPNGLTVTQQGVPVPVSQGVESLNAALKPQGLALRFLEPEKIAGGGQSATVEVDITRELPGGGSGIVRLRVGQVTTAIVPGGDFLASHPSEPASSAPVSEPSPPDSPAPGAAPEPAAASGADEGPSPVATSAAFDAGSGGTAPAADFTLPTSSATLGVGSAGAASSEPEATSGVAATPPEVAVATPEAGGRAGRRAGRLAATTAPRAVDGVYAAVAWATIAVLALSLIWRQGARKWTS